MKTTHYLEQSHCRGNGKGQCVFWAIPCNILKTMPDGRLKVEKFGTRWKGQESKRTIQYVESNRVYKKTV